MKMTTCRRNHKNTGTTVKFEAANYPEQEHRPGERGTNNRTEEEGRGWLVGWFSRVERKDIGRKIGP